MAIMRETRSFGLVWDIFFEESFVAVMAEVLRETSAGDFVPPLAATGAGLPFSGAHSCVGWVGSNNCMLWKWV